MGLAKLAPAPRPERFAALLNSPGIDIMQVATRFSEVGLDNDARILMKLSASFQDAEDKLAGYAEEVKTRQVKRDTSNNG